MWTRLTLHQIELGACLPKPRRASDAQISSLSFIIWQRFIVAVGEFDHYESGAPVAPVALRVGPGNLSSNCHAWAKGARLEVIIFSGSCTRAAALSWTRHRCCLYNVCVPLIFMLCISLAVGKMRERRTALLRDV